MSYEKGFLTVADHAVGLQSVNRAIDNNQALFDAVRLRHAYGVDGRNTGSTRLLQGVGRHDDILIARTTSRHLIRNGNTSRAEIISPIQGLLLGRPTRIDTGQWRFPVGTQQIFGGVALAEAASALDYKACCLVAYSPATTITVATWAISAGAFIPYDFDFSLTLWVQSSD